MPLSRSLLALLAGCVALSLVGCGGKSQTTDGTFLANYAYINLVNELARVPGIARVQVFGAGQYAMRCWVKPGQLAKLHTTVPQIIQALQTQNEVKPAGRIGGERVPSGHSG
jgi:hydrophobic/amphiphilic exporter-1 (mainly G- bacteria), HAE1 family